MPHDIQKDMTERALLVHVIVGKQQKREAQNSLEELERLADTAGAEIVGSITQHRSRPTASFFIGEGKLADIQLACRKTDANLVVFNNELSPVQVNNLDLALGIKVIDRTELILQIFARRASSAEAQIQVELAQLQYLVSRVPASVKQHRFHGGIGMRGPGESPFQLRAAPMRKRIQALKKKLVKIQERRKRTRKQRGLPLVCLVGYTNAGKSTLLNGLAAAAAYVDDRLFATLDTKTRLVHVEEGKKILITDTVGFIRDLPHGLVASFHSTLEEVAEADLLLLVLDASSPSVPEHIKVVRETLADIGASEVPSVVLLNKTDRQSAEQHLGGLRRQFGDALSISALRRQGLDEVKKRIAGNVKFV